MTIDLHTSVDMTIDLHTSVDMTLDLRTSVDMTTKGGSPSDPIRTEDDSKLC
jgi:hypothetical protein